MEPLQYLRNHNALSAEDQAKLEGKRVMVAGCGGLGGYVVETLGRLGLGFMRVVDEDQFELSNLNRQLYSSHANLGSSKAFAAKERMAAVNPYIEIEAVEGRICPETAMALLEGCDLVIDCLDNIPTRRLLQAAAEQAAIPMVHGAVAGWRGQVCLIEPGERLLDELYPDALLCKGIEETVGTLSFTVAMVAAIQSSLTITRLLSTIQWGRDVLLIDLKEPLFQRISLK